jgi:ATP-binding cassette subfamily C (CFTR/MRP) protein 1
MNIDPDAEYAIDIVGNFRYESATPPDQDKKDDEKQKKKDAKELKKKEKVEAEEEKKRKKKLAKEGGGPGLGESGVGVSEDQTADASEDEQTQQKPFELRDIKLKIPAGTLS